MTAFNCNLTVIESIIFNKIFWLTINSPKINEPIKKWATKLHGTFSKE
jgi:hypothetical protein